MAGCSVEEVRDGKGKTMGEGSRGEAASRSEAKQQRVHRDTEG